MNRLIYALPTIFVFLRANTAFCCDDVYHKWQDWMRKAESWGRVSEGTVTAGMVGGSFLGPAGGLLGLLGAGPGAVSHRYYQLARGAERDYHACLERLRDQRERQAQEALEAARQREEHARRMEEEVRRTEKDDMTEEEHSHRQTYKMLAIED